MIYKIEPKHNFSRATAPTMYFEHGGDKYTPEDEKAAREEARQKSGLGGFKNWRFFCIGYINPNQFKKRKKQPTQNSN